MKYIKIAWILLLSTYIHIIEQRFDRSQYMEIVAGDFSKEEAKTVIQGLVGGYLCFVGSK